MKWCKVHFTILLILFQLCLCAHAQDLLSDQSGQLNILPLPNATIGYKYVAALPLASAEGKVVTNIVGGQLPPGLHVKSIWITGMPRSPGRFEFEIQAIDEIRQQSRQKFTIEVLLPPAKPLEIRHTSLPDCVSFVGYDQPLLAEGGYPPYLWRILDGRLPEGLSLKNGRIIGTVKKLVLQPSKYGFTAKVKDNHGQSVSQKFSLKLNSNPSIVLKIAPIGKPEAELGKYIQLPEAVVKMPYFITFAAIGGIQSLKWEITHGNLPDGVQLKDNKLVGTPERTGKFKFTLNVSDGIGQMSRQDFLLRVLPPPAPTLKVLTKKLPKAYRTIPYKAALQAEGGYPPYFWETEKEGFPDWAKLEKQRIVGIPKDISSVRQFTFRASITDSAGTKVDPVEVSLEVEENPLAPPPLEIVSYELPTAYRMVPYQASLRAQGGNPPYIWTVDKEGLPAWLSFDAGRIIGLPKDISAIGQSKIRVSVRDNTGTKVGPVMVSLEVKENSLIQPLRVEIDGELPIAVVKVPYRIVFVASGGRRPYFFSYKGGVEGLSFESDGRIHGSPKKEGKQSIEVIVTDADSKQAREKAAINVINFIKADLQVAELLKIPTLVGLPFQFRLPVTGGITPYKFSLKEPLPQWLKFDPSTGCFSGTPGEVGNWPVQVEVRDALEKSCKITFQLEALPSPPKPGWYWSKIVLIVLVCLCALLAVYFALLVIRRDRQFTALLEQSKKRDANSDS